uniref:Uncharacterized protein n=1 Tax=Arundo donax TaxID=35708 RepID=A0A0A9FVV1_ARUDO
MLEVLDTKRMADSSKVPLNITLYQGTIFQRWLSPLAHSQSTTVVPSWTPPWSLSPWKASKLR